MVIYPDKPGGDDMVKVRLQGTHMREHTLKRYSLNYHAFLIMRYGFMIFLLIRSERQVH